MDNQPPAARPRHPTVDEPSQLDELGSGLSQVWFARGWKRRPQKPDYYLDYLVERVVNDDVSGQLLGVQQKAHRTVTFSDGFASETLSKKHLRYYLERLEIPVFLLTIDTATSRGYFLFVQEWLDQNGGLPALAGNGTKNVRVPQENRIDDVPLFLTVAQRAWRYMRDKHPSSVSAAMKADIARLEAIDPRFAISLNIVDGAHHYRMEARQEFSVNLTVKGAAVQAFKEFYDFGKPITLAADSFEFDDMPLFESLAAEPGKPKLSVGADGIAVDWHIYHGDTLVVVPGTFTRGQAGLLFSGRMPNGPLSVEVKFPPATSARRGIAGMEIKWDLSCWTERPIHDLLYLEEFVVFARLVGKGKPLKHLFHHQGRKFFRGDFTIAGTSAHFPVKEIQLIERAHAIAKQVGIDFKLPRFATLTVDEATLIHRTHDLLTKRVHTWKGPGIELPGTFVNITNPQQLLQRLTENTPDLYEHRGVNMHASLFGATIELGTLEFSVDPGVVRVSEESLAALKTGRTDQIPMRVFGVGNAKLTIRRVATESNTAHAP